MKQPRVVYLLRTILGALPQIAVSFLARILGCIGFWSYRSVRHLALRNIGICLPAEPRSVRQGIAIRSFEHAVLAAIDLLKLTDATLHRRPSITVCSPKRIADALGKGTGLILLTGHFGNLGILPFALEGICKNPAYLWHRPSRRIGWVVAQFRAYRDLYIKPQTGFVSLESTTRGVIQAGHLLKRGNVVIMAADMVWNSGGVPVTFFSKPYHMSRVPASLSIRTNAVLLPVITIRNKNGNYEVFAGEPIEWSTALSRQEAEQHMTEQFAKFLEQQVRRRPEQWNWTHRINWPSGAA